MPLVPRSFQGTIFSLPNIRGTTLYLTVKSLADDLSDAEADDASAGLSSENVRITTQKIASVEMFKVAKKCQKVTPIDIQGTDTQSGAYRLTKVMDGDTNSWWRMRGEYESDRNYHWYAETEFATPVVVDRYTMTVGTARRSKSYYPVDWTIEASETGEWKAGDTVVVSR